MGGRSGRTRWRARTPTAATATTCRRARRERDGGRHCTIRRCLLCGAWRRCLLPSLPLTGVSGAPLTQGLLHNWGCGLQSRAEALPPADAAAALAALEAAAGKLRSASEFAPEDAAPLNALGDVLQAAAERCAAAGDAGRARALYEQAAEHGYMRALRFDRGNADAQVGVGEVSLALCRGAAAAGDAAGAAEHAARALGAYRAALQKPAELGSVAERMEVAYNAACAAAQAGAAEEALGLLRAVVAAGGATAQECCEDADLAPLVAAAGGAQGLAAALQQQQ